MPALPQTFSFAFGDPPLPPHDLTVVKDAQDRLIQQYKRLKLQNLVGSLATPAQDLEDALNQILTQRWIATAVGAQLDVLGKIVGQPRNNLDDGTYRLFIAARILVNKSSGGPEELYTILKTVLSSAATLELRYFLPCEFTMTIHGVAISNDLATVLAALIKAARVAGVGAQLIWSTVDPSGTFTLDGTLSQALDHGALAEAIGA